MKVVISSDHAALGLRKHLVGFLEAKSYDVVEAGAVDESSYDYPDAADDAVRILKAAQADFGIMICGTGIGISIRANRHKGIRAALCTTEYMARMAREHNDANVLCLGARVLGTSQAEAVVESFLSASVDSNPRHQNRVRKLDGASTDN